MSTDTLSCVVELLFKSLLVFYSQRRFSNPAQSSETAQVHCNKWEPFQKHLPPSGEGTQKCLKEVVCQWATQHWGRTCCLCSPWGGQCGVSRECMHNLLWAKVGKWVRTPSLHHPQPIRNWGVFAGTSWSCDNGNSWYPLLTNTRKGQQMPFSKVNMRLLFWLVWTYTYCFLFPTVIYFHHGNVYKYI